MKDRRDQTDELEDLEVAEDAAEDVKGGGPAKKGTTGGDKPTESISLNFTSVSQTYTN